MITLVTGFPGSGKTYRSVKNIYDIINSTSDIKYDFIYTNINGFKFDTNSKLKRFNEDDFYIFLTNLYNLYNKHKIEDDVDRYLIEYCTQHNYYNCYFVFDECHNFFSLKDDIKIFWLTYHRHLFHEIDLITQNKTLINIKYRGVIEIFINAQPISKKVFNKTLVYKKYSSFTMRQSELFDKETIKINNDIFALYKSGNQSKQKSILVKYFKIMIFAIVVILSLFVYLFNSLKEPSSKPINPNIKPQIKQSTNKDIVKYNDDIKLVAFVCETSQGCTYNNRTYPINYIRKYIKITNSKQLLRSTVYHNKDLKYKIFKILIRTTQSNLNNYFINDSSSNNNNNDNNDKKSKGVEIRTHEGVRSFNSS
jgi:zona occludens toxin